MPAVPPPRIGWPLLPVPDASGRLQWPTLEHSVLDTIRALLQTRPGEQKMHPRFGVGVQRFVGEPDTVTTRARLRETVREGLARWETRILVEAVDVSDTEAPGEVRVEIRFRIRRTGAPKQLGLTLTLGPSTETA
ncbi:MAG: GPW/gp25 family protein [Myxococcota bacterium]